MNALLRALGVSVLLFVALLRNGVAADLVPEIVRIPVESSKVPDAATSMIAGLYRPPGEGPFPILIYSHGRSGTEGERNLTRIPDARGHIRYWLKKGFAVVAAIRPGYGETHGIDREDSGVRYDLFGNCWGEPQFERSASAASEAVLATVRWVREQRWADANRIVLMGASMGGLASVATAATNPEGVVAYINFSGGTGGNGKRVAEYSCGLEAMASLMSAYGRTTHVPGLWLYASNDSFWGSDWPRAWFSAYAKQDDLARFVMTEPVSNGDGHQLLTRGGRLWSDHVDRFLEQLDLAR